MLKQGNFTERPDYFELDYTVPLAEGLVFAGLGRHTGTTRYHDSSLYGNTGTSDQADQAGKWGRKWGRPSLVYDGVDDGVSAAHNPSLICTTSLTIFVQIHSLTAVSEDVPLAKGRIGALGYGFSWYSTYGYFYTAGTSNAVWNHGVNIRDNVPCTLAFTYDGAEKKSYRNGVLISSVAATGTINDGSYALTLGRDSTATPYRFNGQLGDVGVWNRALTLPEIQAISDPSNVMLSVGGNPLLRYRRKWWPVSGTPVGNRRRRLLLAGAY